MVGRIATLICAALLFAAPVRGEAAKPVEQGSAQSLVDALGECRRIADPAQRLACYDAAGDRLTQAVQRREVVLVDKQEIRRTRRSLFGFSIPKMPLFGKDGPEDEEVDELTATIAAVQPAPNGRWQIRLDTGALWRTTEVNPYVSTPKKGQKIVIERGALGSYFLKIEGQRAIRGMRIG
jgi:hypothetical protein